MFQDIYYEDYQVGTVRETVGRTITETDVVMHAGQTGNYYQRGTVYHCICDTCYRIRRSGTTRHQADTYFA